MDNLTMYKKYAQPPADALKEFNNGRFKGTDINPMWRIKVLTEEYDVTEAKARADAARFVEKLNCLGCIDAD